MPEHQAVTTFVGRDSELHELLRGLDDAVSGRGRLYLLGGEPGVGKSRLADELAARAREAGHEALWGRGWEDAGAPPYWPWVQALRAHIRTVDPNVLRAELGPGAAEIAQMLPELREIDPELPAPRAIESESARFQLFDSTTAFIRRAAVREPIVIVLDDLQAADTPSLLLLRFVASQLGTMHALVIGTYRDVALTPDHPLTRAIAELAREPTTRMMAISGLPPDDVAAFIVTTSRIDPPARLVSAVWRQTKGNPLFVGEALRLLSSEGSIADPADLSSLRVAVPAGIRSVIAQRIQNLPDVVVGAMQVGAVLGPEFGVDLLRRVGEFESEDLVDLLDAGVEEGLLLPVTAGTMRYRFSHDLVRETLYDELLPGRRIRIHRATAEVLESLPTASLAELAFHSFQAAQGHGADTDDANRRRREKAIAYARGAAEQAARSLAYEEAARLYRMSLAVLDLSSAPDERLRTEILLALGDVEARSGELEEARGTFREAARIARATGEATHLARAALGYSGRLPWIRVGNDVSAIPMVQDALVLLGGSDDRLRVRLLTRLACAWRSSPERRQECDTLSQQAVDLARQIGDPGTLSYALAGRYWATWWPENPHDRLALAEEMAALAESTGDAERVIDAHLMKYMAFTEIPRMTDAEREEEEVRRLANDLRQPTQLWLGVAPRALMALMRGDYPLAEELIERELRWTNPITTVRDEVSAARMHLYLLRREQGRSAEAEATQRAAAAEFPWYPVHRAALINLLLDIGHDDEARAEFTRLARDRFGSLYRDNEWLLGMALTSEACVRIGDRVAGELLYRDLLPFAGRHAVGQAEGSVGAVDRYLGLLARLLGDLDGAERHLRAAIELHELMGARPFKAHAQRDLARVLLARAARGDLEEAIELLRTARQMAREIGMTALVRQLDAEGGVDEGRTAVSPSVSGAAEAMFVREGDFWAIGRDRVFRLRHAKGLAYLNVLLANPGREFHVLELAAGPVSAAAGSASSGAALGLRADSAAAGEILDPQAKAAYRERLRELQDEVADADAAADPERGERARTEIDAITAELSAAFGLGGRARPEASPAERARQSVTKAVRDALRRIRAEDPALGDHLDRAVRTGLYCAYDPDPAAAISWRTDPGA
jgi:tetratricopeptide (TPR) repeat protein